MGLPPVPSSRLQKAVSVALPGASLGWCGQLAVFSIHTLTPEQFCPYPWTPRSLLGLRGAAG